MCCGLQVWQDGASGLTLQETRPISFHGTPASYFNDTGCPGSYAPPPPPPLGATHHPQRSSASSRMCGLGTPSQTIIRMANDELLMGMYGRAADSAKCSSAKTPGRPCPSAAFYTSADGGLNWEFASRVDRTPAMNPGQGVNEASVVALPDGRVFLAFRLDGAIPLWSAFSSDHAKTWTQPAPMKGAAGRIPYGVWPQLKLLSNGVLLGC